MGWEASIERMHKSILMLGKSDFRASSMIITDKPNPSSRPTPNSENETYPKVRRSHKRRNGGIIGGIVVAVVLVAILALAPTVSMASTLQTIPSRNVTINHAGATSLHFGPSQGAQIQNGLIAYNGIRLSESLTVSNGDLLASHTVNQITPTTNGFTVASVSPALPITLTPGGSASITITFDTPNTGGSGSLTIMIVTDS